MKNATRLLISILFFNTAITMIYDDQGHPDYEAINQQFEAHD